MPCEAQLKQFSWFAMNKRYMCISIAAKTDFRVRGIIWL